MKKILFVINSMEIGGTRRSLINLLNEMVKKNNIECHLLVFSPYGEYMNEIPRGIKLCDTSDDLIAMFSSAEALRCRKDYLRLARKAVLSAKKKVYGEWRVMSDIYHSHIRNSNTHYDLAVGFQEGGCNDYAANADADKKIFWIHNNYENLSDLAHGNPESYKKADSINFVAEASMNSFKRNMPEYADKMRVIKNVLPQDIIRRQSEHNVEDIYHTDGVKLVSVGRVSNQKGFDRLVEVASNLKKKKLSFEWVIIGDGEQRKDLNGRVIENHLEDCVHFIGAKSNPYPYIRQADLYVLTSRYESQPMVVMEALTLGVPVLSTSFESVNEIVEGKGFAATVENSVQGIEERLSDLLENKEQIEEMKAATVEFQYNNDKIINEILTL